MPAVAKEKPIVFSSAMVRAILDGRKTQTRRVIKPQPTPEHWQQIVCDWYEPIVIRKGIQEPGTSVFGFASEDQGWPCPYGAPGDRLWVRETWCEYGKGRVIYKANYPTGSTPISDGIGGPWRPSIFMPHWASRITLEITDVRVERVRDISLGDAIAEGIERKLTEQHLNDCSSIEQACFATLWDSINAKRGFGWEANPWVWVIEFKKL